MTTPPPTALNSPTHLRCPRRLGHARALALLRGSACGNLQNGPGPFSDNAEVDDPLAGLQQPPEIVHMVSDSFCFAFVFGFDDVFPMTVTDVCHFVRISWLAPAFALLSPSLLLVLYDISIVRASIARTSVSPSHPMFQGPSRGPTW